MYIEIKSKKITLEVDSDYGSIRWQLGKLDDLDVLANGDVACVEGGEEHELVLPVLPGVADDAVQRDSSVHRVHEHWTHQTRPKSFKQQQCKPSPNPWESNSENCPVIHSETIRFRIHVLEEQKLEKI